MEKEIIKSVDGYELDLHIFESKENKGIIQIIHGMEEHQDRYNDFANFLNSQGYTVITSNLRGHGANAPITGFFDEKNGAELLVKDQEEILNYIKQKYNVKTINMFAHSMGSIIARNLLQKNSYSYNKVVLSGYPNYRLAAIFGKLIADVIILFRGPKWHSELLHGMAVDSFNKSVKNPKTNLDWLSYNNENISSYINDKYCAVQFTVSAFRDLFVLLLNMNKKSLFDSINDETSILLVRGKDDPCTGFDKGAKNSKNALNSIGFVNLKEIVYSDMRHEILKENNKQKVYNDIVAFYNE